MKTITKPALAIATLATAAVVTMGISLAENPAAHTEHTETSPVSYNVRTSPVDGKIIGTLNLPDCEINLAARDNDVSQTNVRIINNQAWNRVDINGTVGWTLNDGWCI